MSVCLFGCINCLIMNLLNLNLCDVTPAKQMHSVPAVDRTLFCDNWCSVSIGLLIGCSKYWRFQCKHRCSSICMLVGPVDYH